MITLILQINTNTHTNTHTHTHTHTYTHTNTQSHTYRHDLGIISLAMNILRGWDTYDFKDDMFRSVSSSNSFLYSIREPKDNQINAGHQISRN